MPSHHEKEAASPPTGHVVMEKRDVGEKLGLPPSLPRPHMEPAGTSHCLLPSEKPHGAVTEGGKAHPLLSAHHALGILQKAVHTSPQLSLNSPPARLAAPSPDAETSQRDPPRGHSAASAPHPCSGTRVPPALGRVSQTGLRTVAELTVAQEEQGACLARAWAPGRGLSPSPQRPLQPGWGDWGAGLC